MRNSRHRIPVRKGVLFALALFAIAQSVLSLPWRQDLCKIADKVFLRQLFTPVRRLRGGFEQETVDADDSPGVVNDGDRTMQRQASLLVNSKQKFANGAGGGEDAWRTRTCTVLASLHLRAATLRHEMASSPVKSPDTQEFVFTTTKIIREFEAKTGLQVRKKAEVILRGATQGGAPSAGATLAEWKEEERRRYEAARNALLGDATGENEDEDDDEEDEEENKELVQKLGSAMKQFKGAAAQNLNDIDASMQSLDRATAAVLRNIPKASALRRDVNDYLAVARKEGALSFYSKMILIGGMLAWIYIRLKMKG